VYMQMANGYGPTKVAMSGQFCPLERIFWHLAFLMDKNVHCYVTSTEKSCFLDFGGQKCPSYREISQMWHLTDMRDRSANKMWHLVDMRNRPWTSALA